MLQLPFFDAAHRDLAARVREFAAREIEPHAAAADAGDVDHYGRQFLKACAAEGLTRLLVPRPFGGTDEAPQLRSLCIVREAIAACSAAADSVFAVQGLGSRPILLAGSDELRRRHLPRIAAGEGVAAFALTEPEAGSDAAALRTTARREGGGYVLDGSKIFISNAGIADAIVVFARTSDDARKGVSAFVVERGTTGLSVEASAPLLAPHAIGALRFEGCRVPAAQRLGAEGDGLKIAYATLDFFRASVGAAACGLAGRALREARAYAQARRQFGAPLSDFQMTRAALAEMATELDAARLLVCRAAWLKDDGADRITSAASMAKLYATEAAQRIVDSAVQIHGGAGVVRGHVVERLYREVRALRIYEGTSEMQRLVIADRILKGEE
jgi:acyl-CoA dehydrogenase